MGSPEADVCMCVWQLMQIVRALLYFLVGKEPVAVIYLYVSPHIMCASVTMKEKSKQASFQRERPVVLSTTCEVRLQRNFGMPQVGSFNRNGRRKFVALMCPSPTGDMSRGTSAWPLAQL